VEDALAAADAGADAIGMVLCANSPRRITRHAAHQILDALPPFVTPVGLFVDASVEEISDFTQDLGLRHVQLHGDEPPETVRDLVGKSIIKAVRVAPGTFRQKLTIWGNTRNLRGLLLETVTQQAGGSGIENDWELIRKHQEAGDFAGLPPIIAAGGLRPENVAPVVRLLHPWAVDVSSGIESSPGIKSKERMIEFVRQVRAGER